MCVENIRENPSSVTVLLTVHEICEITLKKANRNERDWQDSNLRPSGSDMHRFLRPRSPIHPDV